MASPVLQKTAEGKETTQIKQLADLMHNYNRANAEFLKVAYDPDLNSASGFTGEFKRAKADYLASFRKLSDFAVSHVPLLMDMLKISLTDRYTSFSGEPLGLQEQDKKALQLINDLKGTYTLNNLGCARDEPRGGVELCVRGKTGYIPLFYFYEANFVEGSEKTTGLAFYPSDEIYKQVKNSSVPTKVK
jgi:hypothetical protein